MKKLRYLRWLFLVSVAGFVTSCGSLSSEDWFAGRHFHDAAEADVIVRFYGWNSIHLLRPDVREDGFLPKLDREGVARKLDRPDLGRGLAVVLMGYMFTKAEETQLIHDWDTLFSARGFRRVVLLRASSSDKVDGLLILHDSVMSAIHAEPQEFAVKVAAVPAAARADAANSSGRSVR